MAEKMGNRREIMNVVHKIHGIWQGFEPVHGIKTKPETLYFLMFLNKISECNMTL